MSTLPEDEPVEPEATHPTPAMQQPSGMPLQQAYPYVTRRIDPDEDDQDTASVTTTFGSTLVQHVCRNLNDTQAHEAVINKTWFQKLTEHDTQCRQRNMVPPPDASRVPQHLQTARTLSRTLPAWASKKIHGEAALWFQRKDNGAGQASSSHSSTSAEEEFKYPLHEAIAPSLQCIETFLAEEKKEPEKTTGSSLTMSWTMPFPDSTSSSLTQLGPSPAELARLEAQREKDDEEYQRLLDDCKANEEDWEDYWQDRYADID